jgi:hypothetical protein
MRTRSRVDKLCKDARKPIQNEKNGKNRILDQVMVRRENNVINLSSEVENRRQLTEHSEFSVVVILFFLVSDQDEFL